jgi:hypothetical protein
LDEDTNLEEAGNLVRDKPTFLLFETLECKDGNPEKGAFPKVPERKTVC